MTFQYYSNTVYFPPASFLHEETDYLWLIRSSLYVAASEDPVEGGCTGKVLTV